ncbi:MAG: hypothetical protein AB1810_06775 [Pseudomonadota bacterium]
MAKQNIWMGFLEAGPKSSPVLRDDKLETGNPKTIYLFNLNKGEILEYSRALVEPKLRDLTAAEQSKYAEEMQSRFGKASADFQPKGKNLNAILRAKPMTVKESKRSEEVPLDEDLEDFPAYEDESEE